MRSAKTKLIPDPSKETSLKSVKDQKMMVILHPGEVKRISQAGLKSSSQKVKFVTKFSYDNPIPNSTKGIPKSKKSPRLLNPDRHTDYGSIPIIPRDSADSYQPASACTTPPTPCLLEPALTLGSSAFPHPRPPPNPNPGQQPQQTPPSRPPHPTQASPVPPRTLNQPQHHPSHNDHHHNDHHHNDHQQREQQEQQQRALVVSLKHKVRTQAQRILDLESRRPPHSGEREQNDVLRAAADRETALKAEVLRLEHRLAQANAVVRKLVVENELLSTQTAVCAACRPGGRLEGAEEGQGRDWRNEGVEVVDMEGGSTYQVNKSDTKDVAIQVPTSGDRAAIARDAHVQTDQAETRSEVSRADFQVDAGTQEPDELPESRVIEHAKQLLLKHLWAPTLSKFSSSQEAIKYLSVSESVVIRPDTLKKCKVQQDSQQISSGWFTVFEFVQLLVDTLGLLANNIDGLTSFNPTERGPTDLAKSGVRFCEHLTTLVHTAEDTVDQLALKQISHFHPHSTSNIDHLVKDFEAQAVSLRLLFTDLSAHAKTTTMSNLIQADT